MPTSRVPQTPHSELVRHFVGRPMAVESDYLRTMVEELSNPHDLAALTFGWGSAVEQVEIRDGIGVLSVRGPLLQSRYWTDYSDIQEAFNHLLEDGGARAIVLDIDSPGGDVHSELNALATAIREARSVKPIHAVANNQATSAAYWLAAAASSVHLAGSVSVVGSIGVIAMHTDRSESLKQRGIAITEIVSGARKNELSSNKPLSSHGRSSLQRLVGIAYEEFSEAITASRDLSRDAIDDLQGAALVGEDAIAANLAEGQTSLDDLVERLAEETRGSYGAPLPRGSSTSTDGPSAPEESIVSDENTTTTEAGAEGAEVVNIDAARDEASTAARDAERARASAINGLCALSGCPERAMDFYSRGMTEEQVRTQLLEEQAANAGDELDNSQDGGGEASVPAIDVDAVYRRWNGQEAK